MLYGHLRKGSRNKSQNETSCTKKKHQFKKYEDTTNSLLKQNIWSTDPGLWRSFWSHRHEEKQAEKLCDRTTGAHHQNRQASQLPQNKSQMGIERLPGQIERIVTFWFSCFHKTRISHVLPNGSQQRMGFHFDLNTAFLQRQSHDVNRDVVCQPPPEAGHPPDIAARLKKPAYGVNDAPLSPSPLPHPPPTHLHAGGISFTKHCVVMAWFLRELIYAVTCCTQYNRLSEPWTNGTFHSGPIQATSQINRVCGQK